MNQKYKAWFACECGWEGQRRVNDVIFKPPYGCPSCSRRDLQLRISATPEGKARLLRASAIAAERNVKPAMWTRLRRLCQVAKDRCTNSRNAQFGDYGGRGIRFEFGSASAMAAWLIENLGEPPVGMSIDRRDNNLGYRAGNLRWATRQMQIDNRRRYRRSEQGERLRYLVVDRPDVVYETLRSWIKLGLTDEQIHERKRGSS